VRTSPGLALFLSTCFVELERSTNGVGVGVGVFVGVGALVDVGVAVPVLVGVAVGVGVAVLVLVSVGVAVLVLVDVSVALVPVGVAVGVLVDVDVFVGVGVLVLVGVGVTSFRVLSCGLSVSTRTAASMDEPATINDRFPLLSALVGDTPTDAAESKPKIKNSNANIVMVRTLCPWFETNIGLSLLP